MAKQSNFGRLYGKFDGNSYYYSKVGGDLVRKINTAMSERVKTDAAFANTRLNASEFGGAGMLAGQIISPVSSRWRYILNPVATGQLTKLIKEMMLLDTTNPWGERKVQLANMPTIQAKYNEQSKNEMLPEIITSLAGAHSDDAEKVVVLDNGDDCMLTADTANKLSALGIEGYVCNVYRFAVSVPSFDSASGKYVLPARAALRLVVSTDDEVAANNVLIPNEMTIPSSRGTYYYFDNDATTICGMLVVFLPYAVVNNQKHTLQQHCSAYWQSFGVE